MIIEFTGCTGAGKTTYAHNFYKGLVKKSNRNVIFVSDIFDNEMKPNCVFTLKKQGWRTDLYVLPYTLLSVIVNLRIFTICLIAIILNYNGFFDLVLKLRVLLRRMGLNQYFRARKELIIIQDEGISHLIHNIWVNPVRRASGIKLIEKFLNSLDCIDVIALVWEEEKYLLDVIHKRDDKSSRVNSKQDAISFVQNAYIVFSSFKCWALKNNKKIKTILVPEINNGRDNSTGELISLVLEKSC